MESQEYLDNEILSKSLMDDYNIELCINIARKIMKKFQRLINSCPEEPVLRITPRYEPILSSPMPRKNNTMDIIDKHLDDIRDYDFMKEKIKSVMMNMNSEERACFVMIFLQEKTEYAAAKILGRSRNGTTPLINSSALRLVLAFHMEVMKNENPTIEDKEIQLKYY